MKQRKIVMAVKRKRTLFSILAVAVVLPAFAYFAVLPQIQASGYISTVKTKQVVLRTEVDKLKGLFDLDLFTKPSQPSKVIHADIETATEVVTGIKNELSANEDSLTNLQEYPLLFLHPEYNNALNLKKLEDAYIRDVKTAVVELEAILAYFEASADIASKVEAGSKAVGATAKLKTIKQMITAFEKATKSMQEGLGEYEQLIPPKPLKQYHNIALQYNEGLTKLFGQFVAALKSGNESKISILSSQITTLTNSGNSQAEILLKDFVNESTLRKKIDQANITSQDIAKILTES